MNRQDWDRRYAGGELVWTSRANRFLVEEARSLPPGRALDLACGAGRHAVWLAERGWAVTGVDFSAAGIGKARELAVARGVHCDWVVADLLDYRPAGPPYELVVLFYLQVPADERRTVVTRAAGAVGPRGTFLMVGHDSANLSDGHGGPHDPAVLYTAADVEADLAGTGLTTERAERVQRPVETPAGTLVALDALIRARRECRD
jgi:SAM-dependent methyltransferase